ncbi:hypothetical protein [Mucilaginibacter frigoritolerans]|uniref:hypothetical protein n=1 Tax=Mucilaginibacter frigoritolerans TaxID=652788 RepID=UPI00119D9AB2|nr:hypothetical protein [Mucilaginibacter frigoritolerans]
MKKYILFVTVLLAAISAKAQSGYNYYEWGWGADVSYERGYTNITKQNSHVGANLNLVYNYNPYLPITAELQFGQLSGGGLTTNLDPFGRKYTNNFKALIVHADVQLGAAIDYDGSWVLNALKNFYAGTGFGIVINSNKVQRTNVIAANGPLSYVFPGRDNSISPAIPLRFGYEFKIYDDYNQPSFAIDLGYVHSFVYGEGLDGYNDPGSKFKNDSSDQYRQITIGFKYYFGNTVSYIKQIRTFGY